MSAAACRLSFKACDFCIRLIFVYFLLSLSLGALRFHFGADASKLGIDLGFDVFTVIHARGRVLRNRLSAKRGNFRLCAGALDFVSRILTGAFGFHFRTYACNLRIYLSLYVIAVVGFAAGRIPLHILNLGVNVVKAVVKATKLRLRLLTLFLVFSIFRGNFCPALLFEKRALLFLRPLSALFEFRVIGGSRFTSLARSGSGIAAAPVFFLAASAVFGLFFESCYFRIRAFALDFVFSLRFCKLGFHLRLYERAVILIKNGLRSVGVGLCLSAGDFRLSAGAFDLRLRIRPYSLGFGSSLRAGAGYVCVCLGTYKLGIVGSPAFGSLLLALFSLGAAVFAFLLLFARCSYGNDNYQQQQNSRADCYPCPVWQDP